MRKKIFIPLLSFFLLLGTMALSKPAPDTIRVGTGIPYYDAQSLKNLKPGENAALICILKLYNTSIYDNIDSASLMSSFTGDTFIQNIIKLKWVKPTTATAGLEKKRNSSAMQNYAPYQASLLSSNPSAFSGATLESQAIVGVGKFIANRAKEELVISMLSNFKALMDKAKKNNKDNVYIDLTILFPLSYKTLSAVEAVTTNYQAYIGALQASFQKDLNNLPQNLAKIPNTHRGFFSNPAIEDLKPIILNAISIVNQIQQGQSPGNIIAKLNVSQFIDTTSNFVAGIKTLKIISGSIHSIDTAKSAGYWVNLDSLKTLINDDDLFNTYLGLLIEQFKTNAVIFNDGTKKIKMDTFINGQYGLVSSIEATRQFITGFAEKVNNVEKVIDSTKSSKGGSDSAKIDRNCKIATAFIEVFQNLQTLSNIAGLDNSGIFTKLNTYTDISQSGANIILDINRRNYKTALTEVFNIYNDMTSFPGANKVKYVDNDNLDDTTMGNQTLNQVMGYVYKFGNFVAILADTSSTQVANDLENLIPIGTYRDKRDHYFNVAINAYCGFFNGYERVAGADLPYYKIFGQWNSTGVTAPIGISVTYGKARIRKLKYWSFTGFISVVDLGVVTAFRYDNGATTANATPATSTNAATTSVGSSPNITWKDVFSPGGFLNIGIPYCPLSLNLGAQMGPNLRNISTSTGGVVTNNYATSAYWRYSISLCVDIPIINLHTSTN